MARCFLLLIGMSVNGENIFAGAYVDRHGHVRTDPDWLSAAIQSDASWFVPVWGTRCLTDGEPPSLVLLQRQNIDEYISDEDIIFLGMYRERPTFAVGMDKSVPEPFAERGQFHDLRYLGSILPADDAPRTRHRVVAADR